MAFPVISVLMAADLLWFVVWFAKQKAPFALIPSSCSLIRS